MLGKALVLISVFAIPVSAGAGEPAYTAFAGSSYAIEHVEVIDGLGSPPKYDLTVVVTNGAIAALGPSKMISPPPGLRVVDGRGNTLMPGIVGMHEHLYYETGDDIPSTGVTGFLSAPKLYLAGGVTTARTTGSLDTYGEIELKKRITDGRAVGPDLDVTGPYLSGPAEPLLMVQYASLSSPQDARETVDFWTDRKSTRLNSSHSDSSRMPSSA